MFNILLDKVNIGGHSQSHMHRTTHASTWLVRHNLYSDCGSIRITVVMLPSYQQQSLQLAVQRSSQLPLIEIQQQFTQPAV